MAGYPSPGPNRTRSKGNRAHAAFARHDHRTGGPGQQRRHALAIVLLREAEGFSRIPRHQQHARQPADHHAQIVDGHAIGQHRGGVRLELRPGLARVRRAKQVAAQPEGQQTFAADRHQSEETAFIGRWQDAPGRATIVGAIQLAAFGRDVQPVADANDAIEVIVGRQLTLVGRGLTVMRRHRRGRRRELRARPGPAAVVGGEIRAVGAHRDAADTVRKPQVEQRLLGFRREVGTCPGLATVDRVENGLVVAHGPAVLASAKNTAVSMTRVGTLFAWRQFAPWSSESSTWPRSPTATRRAPAAARSSSSELAASGSMLGRLVGRVVGVDLRMRHARGARAARQVPGPGLS